MAVADLELALPDDTATEELGAALAQGFPGTAGTNAALYLTGDLGAGKTTCVRALLRTFGVSTVIRSPTYTLMETYQLPRMPALTCVHVDLYRLEGLEQVEELGLRDFMSNGNLLLVEWPERGGGALPVPDVDLALEFASSGRRARLWARTDGGVRWLRNLRYDTRLASYLSNLN